MLEGEVDVVADGDRYTLRPGDVFWTGYRLRARVLRDAGRSGALARDVGAGAAAAPLVPVRARLGLPRRAARLRRRRVPHEPRQRRAGGVLDDLELYTRIYRQMLLIRGFEELVQSLFLKGEVYGTTHLYSGQEAVATGVASLLEERRPRGGDLSRARSRPRARRRPAGAARRDARARDGQSTAAAPAR